MTKTEILALIESDEYFLEDLKGAAERYIHAESKAEVERMCNDTEKRLRIWRERLRARLAN